MAETLFDIVTRKEWRARTTEILLGRIIPIPAFANEFVKAFRSAAEWGDPYPALRYYTSRQKPLPAWLTEMLIENSKPHKPGRHAHAEERAKQRASDLACFYAVEDLVQNRGLKRTPAEARTAEAMNLSRQAVHDAWKREKNR